MMARRPKADKQFEIMITAVISSLIFGGRQDKVLYLKNFLNKKALVAGADKGIATEIVRQLVQNDFLFI